MAKLSLEWSTGLPLVELPDQKALVPCFSHGDDIAGLGYLTIPEAATSYNHVSYQYGVFRDLSLHYYSNNEVQMHQSSSMKQLTEQLFVATSNDEESVVSNGKRTHKFSFYIPEADLLTDSYYGYGCTLRLLLVVKANLCDRGLENQEEKFEFMVVNKHKWPPANEKLRIRTEFFEPPFECIINVNFIGTIFGIKNGMSGSISVKFERCYLDNLTFLFRVKETVNRDKDPVEIIEEVGQFDFHLQGLQLEGDCYEGDVVIPLSGFSLTPSYALENDVFSVEYEMSLKYRVVERNLADDDDDWEVLESVLEKDSDEEANEKANKEYRRVCAEYLPKEYNVQSKWKKITLLNF